jgi:hypothetical protein
LGQGAIRATFKALKGVGAAKHLAWQMITATRGRRTDAAQSTKVVTQVDYEDALAAAKRRIGDLKLKEANRAITIERPF